MSPVDLNEGSREMATPWISGTAVAALAGRELVRFFRQRSRVVGALAQPVLFWLLFGAGLQGSFTLKVIVAPDGTIEDISVIKSSGASLLERAAKEHLRRFARLGNGEKREVEVPFDFKLD